MRPAVSLWLAVGWLAALILSAIFAPLLPLHSPTDGELLSMLATPGAAHWFGADSIGRDIFARAVYGARVSLVVALGSVAIGLSVGGLLGILAGYFGGLADRMLTGTMTVVLCFPALVLAIAVISSLGPSLTNVTLAIGLLFIPAFARIARAGALGFREREFVLAAHALGAGSARILVREIVPNLVPTLLSYALVMLGVAILAEASLGFLGLSVRPPAPSWGGMIASERANMVSAPHAIYLPALVMFFSVLSINVLGERVRRLFDIRGQAL